MKKILSILSILLISGVNSSFVVCCNDQTNTIKNLSDINTDDFNQLVLKEGVSLGEVKSKLSVVGASVLGKTLNYDFNNHEQMKNLLNQIIISNFKYNNQIVNDYTQLVGLDSTITFNLEAKKDSTIISGSTSIITIYTAIDLSKLKLPEFSISLQNIKTIKDFESKIFSDLLTDNIQLKLSSSDQFLFTLLVLENNQKQLLTTDNQWLALSAGSSLSVIISGNHNYPYLVGNVAEQKIKLSN